MLVFSSLPPFLRTSIKHVEYPVYANTLQFLRLYKYRIASVFKEFMVWSVRQTCSSRITLNLKHCQRILFEGSKTGYPNLECQPFPRVLYFPITHMTNIESWLSLGDHFFFNPQRNYFWTLNSHDWNWPTENKRHVKIQVQSSQLGSLTGSYM